MTRINPIAELAYAADQLELMLDEYQYRHAWDDTASKAQTAIERLRQSVVTLRQQESEMGDIIGAFEESSTAAEKAIERLKIANYPACIARMAKESGQ